MRRIKLLGGLLCCMVISTAVFAGMLIKEDDEPDTREEKVVHNAPKEYKVNKNGETYGENDPELGYEPELIAAVGEDGNYGYVKAEDFDNLKLEVSAEEKKESELESMELPLYDKEGEEIIDTFRVGN